MPTYEYDCPSCGDFTAMRRISERDQTCACPECGTPANRVLLTAPAFAGMPAATRQAIARNELAANVPKQSSQGHGAGCSCCGGGKKNSKTVKNDDGSKLFPTKRPWMISH